MRTAGGQPSSPSGWSLCFLCHSHRSRTTKEGRLVSRLSNTNQHPRTESKIDHWLVARRANQRVELSVPDGHSIKSVDLNITAGTLGNSIATNLSQLGDFDGNAVYDGMDVNKSSLQILPQDWRYDFESGTWAPEWTRSGTSNWAIIADTRLQGAQLAKAGTISHNQESRMTLDVSQLPASTGTFRYSVSSESSFDYLLFVSTIRDVPATAVTVIDGQAQ